MLEIPNLECIGQVAVFYIPIQKLELIAPSGKKVKDEIQEFLLTNFNALTIEETPSKGFWRDNPEHMAQIDLNHRYEVSFDGGEDRVRIFVDFLSWLCHVIEEKAIYVTMGRKSYLVRPNEV